MFSKKRCDWIVFLKVPRFELPYCKGLKQKTESILAICVLIKIKIIICLLPICVLIKITKLKSIEGKKKGGKKSIL